MKHLYAITNKAGRHLCVQSTRSESEAIKFAKMYGVRGAFSAKPIPQ